MRNQSQHLRNTQESELDLTPCNTTNLKYCPGHLSAKQGKGPSESERKSELEKEVLAFLVPLRMTVEQLDNIYLEGMTINSNTVQIL